MEKILFKVDDIVKEELKELKALENTEKRVKSI